MGALVLASVIGAGGGLWRYRVLRTQAGAPPLLAERLALSDQDGLPRRALVQTETGERLKLLLTVTTAEQTQGLSGVKPEHWPDDWGMLFIYTQDSNKGFWMPDTYFDLDILFLDADLRVMKGERNVPFHPGWNEPPPIARTPTYFVRHVLEVKSGAPISRHLHDGSQLHWVSQPSLPEIITQIRERGGELR